MVKQKKYKLLLINPWIYDFTAYDLWSKPVGLLYIAAYLKKIGYQIDYIDCLDKHHPALLNNSRYRRLKVKNYGTGPYLRQPVEKPAILDFIPRHFARYGIPEEIFISELEKFEKPDAILVTSFMTYWYLGPKRIVELLRKIFPGVPIILGGIYATLLPNHAKEVVKPDYIVEGPGEIEVTHILASILENAPVNESPPENFDEFPTPLYELYHKVDYLPILTSRGCPYHCTFCATDKISGQYTQRSPEKVIDEILINMQKFKVRDIAFYDDALLLNKKQRIIPILRALIKLKHHLRFHTPNGLHVKEIDEELAQLFYRSGFKTIRLSFESIHPDRQLDMKNKVTPGNLSRAVANLEKAGYKKNSLEAYVMMGLPRQSMEEVYESILFVHTLGIKIRLASYSPIPGTVDYDRAIGENLFQKNADPLLTNKTVFPLYRTYNAYVRFSNVRQFANMLNYGVDRGCHLGRINGLKNMIQKVIDLNKP
jgi:radical SAM superfamily enzyme YgiQ (UPF0313 family)